MPIPVRLLRPALCAALLAATATAGAKPPPEQPDNLLNDTFTLQAGIVFSSNSTDVRKDSSAGTPGTELNGEGDLGLASRKLTGLGELTFRIRKRHRIRIADYFVPLDRSATRTLATAINFGDTTYNVGDSVNSELKVHALAIAYTYSFVKNEHVELGASLGFNEYDLATQVAVPSRLRYEYYERSAPAPLLGLEGEARLSSRFYVEARFQDMHAHFGEVHGTLSSYQGNLLYRYSPNVTAGLGYIGYHVDVDVTTVGDSGHFALRSAGPQLFARVGF